MKIFARIENEIGGRDENRDTEVSSRSPPHFMDAAELVDSNFF